MIAPAALQSAAPTNEYARLSDVSFYSAMQQGAKRRGCRKHQKSSANHIRPGLMIERPDKVENLKDDRGTPQH